MGCCRGENEERARAHIIGAPPRHTWSVTRPPFPTIRAQECGAGAALAPRRRAPGIVLAGPDGAPVGRGDGPPAQAHGRALGDHQLLPAAAPRRTARRHGLGRRHRQDLGPARQALGGHRDGAVPDPGHRLGRGRRPGEEVGWGGHVQHTRIYDRAPPHTLDTLIPPSYSRSTRLASRTWCGPGT